ncbi:hypothetical protein G6F56_001083 [Rhizopus delemar]|nr:hypothetical protein G6F56_001083 [Rhizopus delemar]
MPLISQEKLDLLDRQFAASPFAKQPYTPTRLAVFDFDNTLFFSPQLSPTIWHPNVLKLVVAENKYGPGWWRDIRSMQLHECYWNEDIVAEARACIADPHTLTVVLTGRRHHPFFPTISTLIESKQLAFDMISLRPDPELASEYRWKSEQGKINYHVLPSVFDSTMHFKECFLYRMLKRLPSIRDVCLWDDRIHHIHGFRKYLGLLKQMGMLNHFRVKEAPPLRPKYNPAWEKKVLSEIIRSHNLALRAKQGGATCGKVSEEDQPGDPIGRCNDYLTLGTTAIANHIQLTEESIQRLRQTFESMFRSRLARLKIHPGAEEALFFGQLIGGSNFKVGEKASIEILRVSRPNSQHWMCLDVKVSIKEESYYDVIALYYRPSDERIFEKIQKFQWDSLENKKKISLEGRVVEDKRIDFKNIELNCWIGRKQVDHEPKEIEKILSRGSALMDKKIFHNRSPSPETSRKKKHYNHSN